MSAGNATHSTTWAASMLTLLHRQHEMMDRLVELSQAQGGLIADGRTDRLLDLLAKRQLIIDEFTTAQQEMGAMTQLLDQRLNEATAEQREQIRSLINSIGERLSAVMRHDEQDQASLRLSRDHVKRELGSVGTVRQARSAYQPVAVAPTRFADQRG